MKKKFEEAGAKVDITEVAVNQVSPTWGDTITKKARNALIVFLVILSIYISIRFEWRMAVAAIAAMIHDVGISVDKSIMNNAAERLLNLTSTKIEDMAKEIIFGQLRLTVASLTIEQINQDRESFLESIRKNVEPELNKIGL
ncbi:hypothetical protein B4Q13_23500, partial [Lacticaseibacillus rhamnosus]